jgi:Leucine-rich repeat (LRR) protein
MGMLNKARGDVEEAMRLLQTSSIGAQISASEKVKQKIENVRSELGRKIDGIKHDVASEVAALLRSEMLHRQSQGWGAALSEALVRMGVVKNEQDCLSQIEDLKDEAASLRTAKAIYDRDLLEVVKALTAPPPESPGPASPPSGATTSTAVQDCLVCPISGDVMRDPVTVVESGITYDRESLCKSLLRYPDLEPCTGQHFDHPLHYTPSIAVRNLVMMQYGDSYYQKYRDHAFKLKYEDIWKKMCPTSTAVLEGTVNGSTSGDHNSVVVKPKIAATIHSCSSGGDYASCPFDGFDSPRKDKAGGDSCPIEMSDTHEERQRVKIRDLENSALDEALNYDDVDLEAAGDATKTLPSISPVFITSATAQLPRELLAEDPTLQPSSTTSTKEPSNAPTSLKTRCGNRKVKALAIGSALLLLIIVVGVAVAVSRSTASPSNAATATPGTTGTVPPGSTTAERFNSSLPLYTMKSLEDTNSPQYRAYEWVTKRDQVPGHVAANDEEKRLFRMTQRFALATVCGSLGFWDVVNSTGSECQWIDGQVDCNADSKISLVDLEFSPIRGTIPRETGLLTNLRRLALASNQLTSSSIPTELGQLVMLSDLDLASNQLTSSIPTEVGSLTRLKRLSLSNNALTSTIPIEVGQLSALDNINLNTNQLTSKIPTELGKLVLLSSVDLSSNQLNSTIPTELGRLSALTDLTLQYNRLTSTVPTELGKLSQLAYLSLEYNLLTGNFPSEICQLTNDSLSMIFIDCSKVACNCCGCR